MNDLHVNTELTTLVRDDQDANGSTTSVKGVLETTSEVGLVNDGEGLLDITRLGHGNNCDSVSKRDEVGLKEE